MPAPLRHVPKVVLTESVQSFNLERDASPFATSPTMLYVPVQIYVSISNEMPAPLRLEIMKDDKVLVMYVSISNEMPAPLRPDGRRIIVCCDCSFNLERDASPFATFIIEEGFTFEFKVSISNEMPAPLRLHNRRLQLKVRLKVSISNEMPAPLRRQDDQEYEHHFLMFQSRTRCQPLCDTLCIIARLDSILRFNLERDASPFATLSGDGA